MSTKQINIGIIGSSFSTGRKEYNYRFEQIFKKLQPTYNFYNLACGGKGSEKYLHSVIRLKDQYDIDCLLMELAYNRSSMNFPLSSNYNLPDSEYNLDWLNKTYYNWEGYQDWEVHLQHNDGVFDQWSQRPFIRNMTWEEQSKMLNIVSPLQDVQKWQKVQMEIASNYKTRQILAVLDFQSVVILCKQLNIKLVSWSHNFNTLYTVKCFYDLLPDLNRVQFGDYDNARDYYQNLHSIDILCDGCHFHKQIDEQMVFEFLVPSIRSAVQKNK